MVNLKDYRIIDLTLPFSHEITGFQSIIAKTLETDGWNARTLSFYSHAGTHMDAPIHFGEEGTLDEMSPEQFMGAAWICRVPIHESQQSIGINDLGDLARRISLGDSLIIQTAWSHFIGQKKYRDELPRISEELAQWCVEKRIKMLAVEPPSIADVHNLEEVTKIHKILLRGNVTIVEGLCKVEQIKQDQVFLIALPIKVKEGDGAPARVLALEKRTTI